MLRQAAYLALLLGVLFLGATFAVGKAPADPPLAAHVPGEVIIKFKSNATQTDINQIYAELGGSKIKGLGRIKAELRRLGSDLTTEEAISRYRNNSKIQYIEPNYIVEANEIPNDPMFNQLYAMQNTGQTGGTPGDDIHATQAWDVFTGSSSVLVGVIDTGVDYTHPDLAANIWTNPGEIPGNGIDDDGNGFIDDVHGYDFINHDGDPMDDHGHGSHVSGTIGAVGNNGIGVVGVNWHIKIMGLKFLSASGSGSTADAISAIDYATMMGVRLTSNSWGGGGFSQGLQDAIDAADAAGILFVAAAGNNGSNTDVTPNYPSCYPSPNIIAVAATDHNDALASFSNYGATTVDIAAPGVDILSTFPGNTYGSISGTSMATPHVSGALGLIFGRFPGIGHLDAKNLLMNFADPKANLAGKCVTGGRLNAFLPIAEPDDTPPGMITDLAVTDAGSNWLTVGWTATGDDGNVGTASSYVMKYSTSPISAANFDAAMTAPNPPDPGAAGTPESMKVSGLDFSTGYYFAVKAKDEFGNTGDISNVPMGTTLGIPDIAVAPTSLTETLLTGGTSTQMLTLSNAGQGTLDFTVPLPDLITNPTQAQIYVAYGKDEVDPRVGEPIVEGTGGPDGFGYRWVDSDEAFGPTFTWDDISAIGTPALTTGDDSNSGPFPIGFSFSFYGVEYTDFRVCSNGWLSFTSTSTAYSNQPLPNSGAPLNLVAPFWDDLNITSGAVYYYNDGSRLIVQWDNVPHYSAGGPYSFQAVLYPDGTIEYYYLSMGDPTNSATVGIQNATGSDGMNIAFNQAYLHDNMAVRIQAVPQWLTVTPTSGTVYAPNSTMLNVNFATEGLLGGTYEGNIHILSNDPDESPFSVPVTLTVIGAPDVNLSPTSFDFGQVFLGGMPTTVVQVQNPGTDVLHVSDVSVGPGPYTVDMTSFDVPPHGSQPVTVTFNPTMVGMYPASLTVSSDDPDEPTISMSLNGEGIPAPNAQVSPTTLSANLFTGQASNQTLVLHNGGGSPLEWSLGVNLETESLPPQETLNLGKDDLDPRPGILGAGGPDVFGYSWKDSDDPAGPAFNWMDISGTGTTLALTGDDATSAAVALPFSFPFYGNTFNSIRVCTNGWLSFTSTLTSYSNVALPSTSAPPNLLAPFWDDMNFSTTPRVTYQGDASKFIVQYTNAPHYGNTGTYTFEVILYPNGTIVYQYLTMTGTLNSECIGIQNQDRNDGLTVVNNANYVHDGLAIRFQSSPDWLSASPASGTVPAGGSANISVIFNASDLFGGLYSGSVDIATNDPLASMIHVPATLQVTGAPNLELSPTSIDFGTVYVGYPQLRQFTITNTGTDVLNITGISSNNPRFSADLNGGSYPIHIAPLSSTVLQARFSPNLPQTETGILTIASNDPDMPTTELSVRGDGLLPPLAGVSPDHLDSALLTGETEMQQFMLSNTGNSDLNFEVRAFTSFGVESNPEDVAGFDPPKDGSDPRPGILGAGGPDAYGYRWADSDAPNGPVYGFIDISGTGTPVFASRSDDINAGPFPIGFNFPFYGGTFGDFRISSNGFLSFTSTSTDLSNDPLPSTNAPENLVAVFWDDLVVDPTLASPGQVYYQSDPTKLVVQWNNVQKYSEQSGPTFTFEVILFRNGTILCQYRDLGTTRNSATAGIQNADRTIGLTVAYDVAYFDTHLALRIATAPDWLTADPTTGTIPAGGSVPIGVTFDATGLFGGTYNGALQVLSNDPAHGVLPVNATLVVTGVPLLTVAPDPLDFGTVFVGYSSDLTVTATNFGTDHLSVNSVTPGSADYTVSPTSFDLDPYGSIDLTVHFAPQGDGDRSSTLSFVSNAPGSPLVTGLTGAGLYPPVMTASPTTVVGAAAPGGMKTKPLTICNTGGSDLTFTVAWAENTSSAVVVQSYLQGTKGSDVPGGDEPVDPRPGILGSGGPDAFGYSWKDSDEPGGPAYDWVDVSGMGTPIGFPSYQDDGNVQNIPIGFDFPFYGNTFSTVNACTNGWLSFTSTATYYTNQPLPNSASAVPENLLALFWDDMVFDTTYGASAYYYYDGTRAIFQFNNIRRIATTTGPFYSYEVILYPNGDIVYQYESLGAITNSATVGIQNATKDDGLNIAFNAAYVHTGLAIKISKAPGWLTVSPEAGTVPAGECMELAVQMNAAALEAGDYTGVITMSSNDPAHPTVPCDVVFHVQVVSAAYTDATPNTLNLASQGNFITVYMELPPAYDPMDVLLETVKLNGTVPADPDHCQIGDFNNNGIPDWAFKFDRAAVEAILPTGDGVPVTVTGEIADMAYFTGTDPVRVVRPHLNAPNGGENLVAWGITPITWTNPSGHAVQYATIFYSADGGDSWTMVADHVQGTSYSWRVPEGLTSSGLVRVYVSDNQGPMGYDSSDQTFTVGAAQTGVADAIPTVHRLYQNAPNPFLGSTHIGFDLPVDGQVTLKIFDLRGRLVRTLADQWYPAGTHAVAWDGSDQTGQPLAAGIYFYRIQAGKYVSTLRMSLMPR